MYEQLLESYPNYAKNDLVLYQLARAYEAEGRIDDSLATLDRLIEEYPRTEQLDEAQFRRGETLFVQKRYRDAERAYAVRARAKAIARRSTSRPCTSTAGRMFKQQHYEESLSSFFTLLDRQLGTDNDASGDRDPAVLYAAMGRAQQEIVDDTFRVLSIGFSYLDGPESISRYFSRHGARPYGFIAYTNLGDLYLEQERYQDAADAYHAFVDLDPYHAKAPLLQVEVIEAFKKGEFADLVLEGKENFVETYGPGSPYWQRFTFDQQPEVVAHLKSNVTDLAAYHHAEAQKTQAAREYAAAARWYRTYLQSFPDDAQRREDELPARRGAVRERQLPRRGVRVRAHGLRLPVPRQRRRSRLRRAAGVYEARSRAARQRARRVAPSQHRQRLRFAESYSAHAQAATVQTDAAEKLFALGEFGRARDVGRQVVARTPPVDATLQRTAWTVVAHSEFDLAEFAAAETAYVQLLGAVPSGDPQRSEITERIASSIYKQGEQARSAGAARGRRRAFPARGAGRAVLARARDGRVRRRRRAHPDGRLAACDHRARELPERHSRITSSPPT